MKKNKKIKGSKLIPRLSIYKSNKFIYTQLIDDENQNTIISHSSLKMEGANINIEKSKNVGKNLAEKAKKIGIKKIIFNRSGYIYHGRIKALAEGIKEKGINF
jgi:large subunit ribosomal protein L18